MKDVLTYTHTHRLATNLLWELVVPYAKFWWKRNKKGKGQQDQDISQPELEHWLEKVCIHTYIHTYIHYFCVCLFCSPRSMTPTYPCWTSMQTSSYNSDSPPCLLARFRSHLRSGCSRTLSVSRVMYGGDSMYCSGRSQQGRRTSASGRLTQLMWYNTAGYALPTAVLSQRNLFWALLYLL